MTIKRLFHRIVLLLVIVQQLWCLEEEFESEYDNLHNTFTVDVPIILYGKSYTEFHIHTHGLIILGDNLDGEISSHLFDSISLIAPYYYTNHNLRKVKVKISSSENQGITTDVKRHFSEHQSFNALQVVTIEWQSYAYFDDGEPEITVTLEIGSDPQRSFSRITYKKVKSEDDYQYFRDLIEFNEKLIGFSAGDGKRFYKQEPDLYFGDDFFADVLIGQGVQTTPNSGIWLYLIGEKENNGNVQMMLPDRKVDPVTNELQDIDECKRDDVCHSQAICSNLSPGYQCHCKDGFMGDGKTCVNKLDGLILEGPVNGNVNGISFQENAKRTVVAKPDSIVGTIKPLDEKLKNIFSTLTALHGAVSWLFGDSASPQNLTNGYNETKGNMDSITTILFNNNQEYRLEIHETFKGFVDGKILMETRIDGKVPSINVTINGAIMSEPVEYSVGKVEMSYRTYMENGNTTILDLQVERIITFSADEKAVGLGSKNLLINVKDNTYTADDSSFNTVNTAAIFLRIETTTTTTTTTTKPTTTTTKPTTTTQNNTTENSSNTTTEGSSNTTTAVETTKTTLPKSNATVLTTGSPTTTTTTTTTNISTTVITATTQDIENKGNSTSNETTEFLQTTSTTMTTTAQQNITGTLSTTDSISTTFAASERTSTSDFTESTTDRSPNATVTTPSTMTATNETEKNMATTVMTATEMKNETFSANQTSEATTTPSINDTISTTSITTVTTVTTIQTDTTLSTLPGSSFTTSTMSLATEDSTTTILPATTVTDATSTTAENNTMKSENTISTTSTMKPTEMSANATTNTTHTTQSPNVSTTQHQGTTTDDSASTSITGMSGSTTTPSTNSNSTSANTINNQTTFSTTTQATIVDSTSTADNPTTTSSTTSNTYNNTDDLTSITTPFSNPSIPVSQMSTDGSTQGTTLSGGTSSTTTESNAIISTTTDPLGGLKPAGGDSTTLPPQVFSNAIEVTTTTPKGTTQSTETLSTLIPKLEIDYEPDETFYRYPKPNKYLIVAQSGVIKRIDLEGRLASLTYAFKSKALNYLVDVEYDCLMENIYFTDVVEGYIGKIDTNSPSHQVLFHGLGFPEGIAVDWIGRRIYWTESKSRQISVGFLDGSRSVVLFKDGIYKPRDIICDPNEGKIYWTDWNYLYPKIEVADMNGANRRVLLDHRDVNQPNGLTLDYKKKRLCWTDYKLLHVACMKLGGPKKVEIISKTVLHPFSITNSDSILYWTDWQSDKIQRQSIDTKQRLPAIKPGLLRDGRMYGVRYVEGCPNKRDNKVWIL